MQGKFKLKFKCCLQRSFVYGPRTRREINNCSISDEEKSNDNMTRPYLEAVSQKYFVLTT